MYSPKSRKDEGGDDNKSYREITTDEHSQRLLTVYFGEIKKDKIR
jgi:hypothetical protein